MSYEHVPSGIEYLLLIICGNEWPEGDTRRLRADAETWRTIARALPDVEQAGNQAAMLAESGFSGPAADSFKDFWSQLTSGGNQSFFASLAQVCGQLADSLDQAADEIETVRIDIVACVLLLAAELAWDAAMAFFTADASEATALEEVAVTRLTVTRIVRKAMTELLIHEIKQTLIQVIIDLIAQAIEALQHHEVRFNPLELEGAAINGAVGSAVGFGAGLFLKGLGKGIVKIDELSGGIGEGGLRQIAGTFGLRALGPTTGDDVHPDTGATDQDADMGEDSGLDATSDAAADLGSDADSDLEAVYYDAYSEVYYDAVSHLGSDSGYWAGEEPEEPHAASPHAASGGDAAGKAKFELNRAGQAVLGLGDIALNSAVGPAEAAAQDAALDNGQVSTSDPQAGALNAIGIGTFGRGGKMLYGVDGPEDASQGLSGFETVLTSPPTAATRTGD